MQDMLRDIVRTTNNFGFEVIKLSTEDGQATMIEAVNADRTVIMKGKTKKAIPGIAGTFGVSSISVLQGILNLPTYKEDTASVLIELNSAGNPEQIVFKNGRSKSVYRLMSERGIPKQPKFSAPAWDVSIEPLVAKVNEFKAHAGVFSSISARFKPQIIDGELCFVIGDSAASNHNDVVVFGDVEIGSALGGSYEYPIDKALSALALGANSEVRMSLSAKGVMQIDIDTGLLELQLVFPGHS